MLGTKPYAITVDSRFADLIADSLDFVELVMKLENEYANQIPDDDYDNIQTIEDAVRYISVNRIGPSDAE